MELAFAKRANDTFETDWANYETSLLPTFYDTAKKDERKSYSY
jgi:hypothetical protein